jgi:hypothetical protein
MWSKQQRLEEVQFHIDAMRSIILGLTMNGDSDPNIYRALNYSLGVLREKRESISKEEE